MMIGLMDKSSGLLRRMIYDYESDMWHWVGAGFLGWHISEGVICTLTFGYIIGVAPLSENEIFSNLQEDTNFCLLNLIIAIYSNGISYSDTNCYFLTHLRFLLTSLQLRKFERPSLLLTAHIF